MRVRFDLFTLDTGRRQLLAVDRDVPLSPKAFDVLAMLVGQRPNVVEKGLILAHAWPDVCVTDASLTVVMAEIRKALGDSASAPRLIRTAHRRGYAFCGSVDPPADEQTPERKETRSWLVHGDARHPLKPSGDTFIGRAPDADVSIDHPSMSRMHARLVTHGDTAAIEDLGSTNGTFVSGGRVAGLTRISSGALLHLGEVALRFEMLSRGEGAPTDHVDRLNRAGSIEEPTSVPRDR